MGRGILPTYQHDLVRQWKALTKWTWDDRIPRLLVYLHYIWTNDQKIDIHKINEYEHELLRYLDESGLIIWNGRCRPKKEFWDLCCDIIYQSYIIYEE